MMNLKKFGERRLDEDYPSLILDARYEKVREDGVIRTRAVMIAIGINWDGRRSILAVELAQPLHLGRHHYLVATNTQTAGRSHIATTHSPPSRSTKPTCSSEAGSRRPKCCTKSCTCAGLRCRGFSLRRRRCNFAVSSSSSVA